MQVKTKNVVVGALAVLLIGMVWFRVVYSPMESKASKANQAAHNAQIDADNLKKSLDDASASNKKQATHDVAASQLLVAVPVDAAEASFLRSLDVLRVTSGADWQSVSPTAPSVTGSVTTTSVSITVQGSEDQLACYLSGLYTMKRVFILDNVTLSQNGTAGASAGGLFPSGLLQLQISGRIFSGPGAVTTGTTGTTGTAATPAPAATTTSGS